MIDFLVFLTFTIFSIFIPSSMVALKAAVTITAFVGLIRLILLAKKTSYEVNEEAELATNENYKNCPFFVGKLIEDVPLRTTSLIKQPMMIRYKSKTTQEEIVKMTLNEAFLNVSKRHKYVKVYYSGSYIVNIFPFYEN